MSQCLHHQLWKYNCWKKKVKLWFLNLNWLWIWFLCWKRFCKWHPGKSNENGYSPIYLGLALICFRLRVKYANLNKYDISNGCFSNFTIFLTHVLDFNTHSAQKWKWVIKISQNSLKNSFMQSGLFWNCSTKGAWQNWWILHVSKRYPLKFYTVFFKFQVLQQSQTHKSHLVGTL